MEDVALMTIVHIILLRSRKRSVSCVKKPLGRRKDRLTCLRVRSIHRCSRAPSRFFHWAGLWIWILCRTPQPPSASSSGAGITTFESILLPRLVQTLDVP